MSRKIRDISLRLKANHKIRIRANEPIADGDRNLKGYLLEGFSVDLVEEWEGNQLSNNIITSNIWYRDKNGDFYWSGGFDSIVQSNITEKILIKENYNKSILQIPVTFRDTKGKGVNVVILDSGTQVSHDSFSSEIKDTFNIIDESSIVMDTRNHGTHLAGIIGARNKFVQDGIIGIAPKCNLQVVKISDDVNITMEALYDSLNWIFKNLKPQIINMSFGVKNFEAGTEIANKISNLLSKLKSNNVICIASASNDELISNKFEKYFLYPARHTECISIGCLSKDGFSRIRPNLSDMIEFILPFEKIYSCINENNKFESFSGSSMSTAIISGVAALYQAYLKNKGSINDFRIFLKDIATPISNSTYNNNPLKIFQNENAIITL
jgi:subtilisin family serine protease